MYKINDMVGIVKASTEDTDTVSHSAEGFITNISYDNVTISTLGNKIIVDNLDNIYPIDILSINIDGLPEKQADHMLLNCVLLAGNTVAKYSRFGVANIIVNIPNLDFTSFNISDCKQVDVSGVPRLSIGNEYFKKIQSVMIDTDYHKQENILLVGFKQNDDISHFRIIKLNFKDNSVE